MTAPETKRRVFNNVFVYLNRYGWLRQYKGVENDVQADGNLHWCVDLSVKLPDGFLDKVRNSEFSEANKGNYPAGWCANDQVADPKLLRFEPAGNADWRLEKGSPANKAGVAPPMEGEDPLRPMGGGKPDTGALPVGSKPFSAGRLRSIESTPRTAK